MTLVEFYESREDWEHITLIGCWIARRADNGEIPDYNTGWCGADREAREELVAELVREYVA